MRQWALDAGAGQALPNWVIADAITRLGQADFAQALLDTLHPLLPAASFSVYRTGRNCQPAFFFSASHGIPDTTRDCWRAYLSGPYLSDRTLLADTAPDSPPTRGLCHITAQEVPAEHRAKVYVAHGVEERVSIVSAEGAGPLFAVNFYRHQHQRPFGDAQLASFEQLAPALLALTQKHILLLGGGRDGAGDGVGDGVGDGAGAVAQATPDQAQSLARQLRRLQPDLTARECEVCVGILQGMTFDGIACHMGLSVPTVKTYRNRAFARMGLHFRSELFARVLKTQPEHA